MDHAVKVLNYATADGEVEFVSSSLLEGGVTEGMHYLRLVRLGPGGAGCYLGGIHWNLVRAYNCGHDQAGQVFS